ncbi:MAG: hypothetical protein IIB94_12565 [Candidatus Marinimicrobia bacterium]|nr:hypothetical protein [Candidatus Neomarinimicrobiota bacterium]
MSDDYEYYVKVFLPNNLTTFQCKDWEPVPNGVVLSDVKNYQDDVTILNTAIVITTEIHGGVGAALV